MKWEREDDKVADFEDVFKLYYSPLVGFFINRGLSRADSEDLAQETLLKAYSGYEKFRKDASHATWIFAIARNKYINYNRDKNAQKRKGEDISLDTSDNLLQEIEALATKQSESSGEISPFKAISQKERIKVLKEVAQELPPQMQRSFAFYFSGKFQHDEIAQILGVEPSTVKSHITQAKGKLIEIIRRRYPEFFVGGGGDDSKAPPKKT